MSDTNIEYQPYLDNDELNRRIVLLEETSLETVDGKPITVEVVSNVYFVDNKEGHPMQYP